MLNVYKLDSKNDQKSYKSLLSSFDNIEPYYLLEYIEIFSSGLDGLICFLYVNSETSVKILMPGYLRPIVFDEETSYFDFITPYGYTGPLMSNDVIEADIISFWKYVDEWYDKNKVVTEFIRFNLSGNYQNYSGDIFPTMLNIKGGIIEEDMQWTTFDHKVRKNVNKAKRENLIAQIFHLNISEKIILEFYNIYILTMKRTNAKDSFFYKFEDFKRFIDDNKASAAICTIYSENNAIASELLLVSNDSVYSFLGGTDDKFFDKRPNDYLKFEVINWARHQGIKYYVLGGGYGMEDGIFKYKRSFFPNDVITFYSGRKIVSQLAYNDLILQCNSNRMKNGLEELDFNDTSFFPLYRRVN